MSTPLVFGREPLSEFAQFRKILWRCFCRLGVLWALGGSVSAYAGPNSVSSAMNDAERLFNQGQYKEAAKQYQAIAGNAFQSAGDRALARCRMGIIETIWNNPGRARSFLELSLEGGALASRHQAVCQYALLQLFVIQDRNKEALTLIRKGAPSELGAVYEARFWALAVEVGKRLGDAQLEVVGLQRLLSSMDRAGLQTVEIRALNNLRIRRDEVAAALGQRRQEQSGSGSRSDKVSGGTGADDDKSSNLLNSVLNSDANVGVGSGGSSLLTGSSQVHRDNLSGLFLNLRMGRLQEAAARLKSLQTTAHQAGFDEDVLGKVRARLARLHRDESRDMRIGLLVPEGSVFTPYSGRFLRAVGAFRGSSATRGVNYTFSVASAPANAGAAESAARDLIVRQHVHVMVALFPSSQLVGVVSLANWFGVPLVTVGPVPAAAELGSPFHIRMGILAESQIRPLVEHLSEKLGFKTAGVIAPGDSYGVEMARAWEAACRVKGITVPVTVFYRPGADVFQDEVRRFLGPQDLKDQLNWRKEVFAARKKEAEGGGRHFDPKSVYVPAHVPVDIVFAPESLDRVRVLAATFAYENARALRFFGDRQWAEGATGRTSLADPFLQGARVPRLSTGVFYEYLKTAMGSASENIDLERQAFDALIMIRQAHYRTSGNNGARMISHLRSGDFRVDGTMKIGQVSGRGEPSVTWNLGAFVEGRLQSRLDVSWPVDPVVEEMTKSATAGKPVE